MTDNELYWAKFSVLLNLEDKKESIEYLRQTCSKRFVEDLLENMVKRPKAWSEQAKKFLEWKKDYDIVWMHCDCGKWCPTVQRYDDGMLKARCFSCANRLNEKPINLESGKKKH